MPRTVPPALAARLAGETLSLARCFRLERKDGTVVCLTTHDRNLVVGGETYLAGVGVTASAMKQDGSLAVAEAEFEGFLAATALGERDLRNGLWDHAACRVFAVDWRDPDAGQIRLRRGWLGEVTTDERGVFRAELRGLAQRLQQRIGEVYTAECRADLGDHRCRVDLAAFTTAGTVESASSRRGFVAAPDFPMLGPSASPNGYDGGTLVFETGGNAGRAFEVLSYTEASRSFELFESAAFDIAPGDTFRVTLACDKRPATCKARFGNFLNFRGEPLVPGQDALLQIGRPAP
jgi:uncharacterized phage protein (TIGR02218 family)